MSVTFHEFFSCFNLFKEHFRCWNHFRFSVLQLRYKLHIVVIYNTRSVPAQLFSTSPCLSLETHFSNVLVSAKCGKVCLALKISSWTTASRLYLRLTVLTVLCHTVICNFWHSGTLTLKAEIKSARMSKITNDGLYWSSTGCFIAVAIWQQWQSKD